MGPTHTVSGFLRHTRQQLLNFCYYFGFRYSGVCRELLSHYSVDGGTSWSPAPTNLTYASPTDRRDTHLYGNTICITGPCTHPRTDTPTQANSTQSDNATCALSNGKTSGPEVPTLRPTGTTGLRGLSRRRRMADLLEGFPRTAPCRICKMSLEPYVPASDLTNRVSAYAIGLAGQGSFLPFPQGIAERGPKVLY